MNWLKKTGLLLWLFPFFIWGQENNRFIEGKVIEKHEDGHLHSLVGASVFWLDTTLGTATDSDGTFKLKRLTGKSHLVVSFVGYSNDTIDVSGMDYIVVELKSSLELDEVKFVRRQKSTQISLLNPQKIEKIGEKELLKAACCNLSESFETNPSVDVTFTDAITGTRQIQMLGLAGPNIQITRENMPDIRGLSAIYGLSYIPGTWIEGIQLIKGTGSVANGYESIAGQINVDLRNPVNMDRLYLNAYANEKGRIEANANIGIDIGKNWGTGILLHAANNSFKHDRNGDGFLDNPLSKQYIFLNRWELHNDKGVHFQVGAKGTFINKLGGQVEFNPGSDAGTTNAWGMHLRMQRLEGWTKIGKVNHDKPWQSFGLQLSGASHHQDSYFGLNTYDAYQNTFYANFLYQSIFSNTNHKFRSGASLQYDDYREQLNSIAYDRKEIIPGAFFEYTYNSTDKFNAVAGLRMDYHNLYGLFFTPRLHLRYAFAERTVLRVSAGRGQRTANVISENNGLLASSRQIIITGDGSNKPYGLEPEIAWNFGLNLTRNFTIDYREGFISFDFFRTQFINQVVVDLDHSPQQAVFYNLDGKSYSNSLQAQIDYELIKRLDIRLAYRWYDVKTTYGSQLKTKPLIAEHRAFLNLAFETRNHWKFDYTLNWQGQKRIPDTSTNPEPYKMADFSPGFYLMNAQISKIFREKLELYLGAENLLNYQQPNPIIASEDPFGHYFDASLIWGPVFGRSVYFGIRYKIK
jgi:outer membrane receptor for ferrienterochelin and colicin